MEIKTIVRYCCLYLVVASLVVVTVLPLFNHFDKCKLYDHFDISQFTINGYRITKKRRPLGDHFFIIFCCSLQEIMEKLEISDFSFASFPIVFFDEIVKMKLYYMRKLLCLTCRNWLFSCTSLSAYWISFVEFFRLFCLMEEKVIRRFQAEEAFIDSLEELKKTQLRRSPHAPLNIWRWRLQFVFFHGIGEAMRATIKFFTTLDNLLFYRILRCRMILRRHLYSFILSTADVAKFEVF